MDDIDSQNMLERYKSSLQKLLEQAALYGMAIPLPLQNDIDFHKKKIQENELKDKERAPARRVLNKVEERINILHSLEMRRKALGIARGQCYNPLTYAVTEIMRVLDLSINNSLIDNRFFDKYPTQSKFIESLQETISDSEIPEDIRTSFVSITIKIYNIIDSDSFIRFKMFRSSAKNSKSLFDQTSPS